MSYPTYRSATAAFGLLPRPMAMYRAFSPVNVAFQVRIIKV